MLSCDLPPNYYSYSLSNDVSVMVLLPNCYVEEFMVNRRASLCEIKDILLKELKTNIIYENELALKNNFSSFIFSGVNRDAEIEEYYDESQLLCNLNLIDFVFNCFERKGNKVESNLTSIINHCIGLNLDDLPKNDYESFDLEMLFARKTYAEIVQEEHENLMKGDVFMYQYSADYDEYMTLPIRQILQSMSSLCFNTLVSYKLPNPTSFQVSLPKDATVQDAITKILIEQRESFGYDDQKISPEIWAEENVEKYVLKIASLDSYMMNLGDKLIFYDYIRSCIYENEVPILSLYPIDYLKNISITEFFVPPYCYQNMPQIKRQNKLDNNSNFVFTLKCAQLMCKQNSKLYVRAALFIGINSRISSEEKSSLVPNDRPNWNEKITFNIEYNNIPRNARLCFSLNEKFDRGGNEVVLGWANVTVFDYFGKIVEGSLDLNLWPFERNHDNGCFNPGGSTHSYKNRNNVVLSIEFPKLRNNHFQELKTIRLASKSDSKFVLQRIKSIIDRDLLSDLTEQDIDFLRSNLQNCIYVPESLPRLASSIKWNSREEVNMFCSLLSIWPKISLESSLQLLGGNYFDSVLRSFAVNNLRTILTNADINLYLLQMIQAVKYESYYYNDLTVFLLQSALRNKQLGQKFFWFMKSDMHNNSIKIYFATILEAFCRGYWNFTAIIRPQCIMVEKLVELSTILKNQRDDLQLSTLKDYLKRENFNETCKNTSSLLCLSEKKGNIIVDACDVKKSKKRPVYLEWENADVFASAVNPTLKFIFKCGDDLRQDMLTLQMLSIFDWIWKRKFQDMKLLPYGCLATGKDTGIIEAVKDAKTVMSVQKSNLSAAMQINSLALYRWIRSKNNSPEKLQKAIETFTRSCAGYSVATFILGIRDRHPDNIMVNTKGQLFHIDFGHILNNRKKKLGVNRERVPFVLTEDFINIIADGCDKPLASDKFMEFNILCGKAYLKLREHSSLILTLYSLMIDSGLPELTRMQDLEYVRKTLSVESNDAKALRYFNRQFFHAYTGNWSTKIDWLSHFLNS